MRDASAFNWVSAKGMLLISLSWSDNTEMRFFDNRDQNDAWKMTIENLFVYVLLTSGIQENSY